MSMWLQAAGRLQTLRGSSLLDAARIPRLDSLTSLIAHRLNAPIALVTLVDEDRQFFLASYGLPEDVRQNSIEHSFCKYAGSDIEGQFRVADALLDPVMCHLLSVESLGVRAYMGVPLHAPNGEVLGATCVIDTKPRVWTDEEMAVLEDHNVAVTAVILHTGSW